MARFPADTQIDEGSMKPKKPNIAQVERGVREMLLGLGVDINSPHVKDTPKRVAKAWFNELCSGLTSKPPVVTTFPYDGEPGMIILHDVPIQSMCSHHLLSFVGTAVIAYIPGARKIVGLSKLSRIADHFARRPQVQEVLTNQIADHVWGLIQGDAEHPGGVGVVIKARHQCMELRGVRHPGLMETSALRGIFHNAEVRSEFLQLARSK